jgi:short-subunit dehydrogenase
MMAKTIVVTGASSGFGKGVAQRLAEQGHNLVLAARRGELLEELARDIGHAIAVPTDVANPDEVQHLGERAIAEYGRIDVWINDAGVGTIGRFTNLPLRDQISVVATNLIGALNGSYVAMQQFVEHGEGTLINVASVAGKVAMPYFAIYGGTKSAILSMSASIRRELELNGQENIHICVVNPWATDTSFFEHGSNYTGHSLRMPMIDDPDIVVDAIVGLIDDPKDEVDVGVKSKGTTLGSHLAPGLTEAVSAKLTHNALMEEAPSARVTSGSVNEPVAAGTEVEGQTRERIAEEDRRKDSWE